MYVGTRSGVGLTRQDSLQPKYEQRIQSAVANQLEDEKEWGDPNALPPRIQSGIKQKLNRLDTTKKNVPAEAKKWAQEDREMHQSGLSTSILFLKVIEKKCCQR